ncbi:hypothetical protein [Brevundimonas sp.]|uniref:hypothetical protein n=1 Tax=Brevundimonas sp. TaxID=1871086 RepID=UPI002ED9E17F
MPTPRDPNFTDRLFEFCMGKMSRHERALLAAARPPKWVRLIFGLIVSVLTAAFLIAVIRRWLPSSWAPPFWPAWSLCIFLLIATQFAKREVYRQYGKRAAGGQWDHV